MYQTYNTIQDFHMIGIVGGIVLCICGIFNVAELLNDNIVLFRVATLVIVGLATVQAYAAWYSFCRPCIETGIGFVDRWFDAKDGKTIGVFILDICSALMFLFASRNFFDEYNRFFTHEISAILLKQLTILLSTKLLKVYIYH